MLGAAVLVAVFVAPFAIAIFVDNAGFSGIVLVVVLIAMGPGALVYGITLDATEHSRKPTLDEEGYEWLMVVRRMPLRMARLVHIALGSFFTIVLLFFLWAGPAASG